MPVQRGDDGDAVKLLERGETSLGKPISTPGAETAVLQPGTTEVCRQRPIQAPANQVGGKLESAADVRTKSVRDRLSEPGSEACCPRVVVLGSRCREGKRPHAAGTGVQEAGKESDPKGREAVVERSLGYPLTVSRCWHSSQIPATRPKATCKGARNAPASAKLAMLMLLTERNTRYL